MQNGSAKTGDRAAESPTVLHGSEAVLTQDRQVVAKVARLVSHAISVLSLLTITSGCAHAQEPNFIGSLDMNVWGISHEGEPALHFRWGTGAYAPTQDNAVSTRGAVLAHPYFRLTESQAVDLAAGIRAWQAHHHNVIVWQTAGGPMALSFYGHDGVTWGPQFPALVIVSCQFWIQSGEGEIHGEVYLPLTESQADELATALESWGSSPGSTKQPIFTAAVQ